MFQLELELQLLFLIGQKDQPVVIGWGGKNNGRSVVLDKLGGTSKVEVCPRETPTLITLPDSVNFK